MKAHFPGRGQPPVGAQYPALCGDLKKGEYIVQLIQQVTCPGCIDIIKKRG